MRSYPGCPIMSNFVVTLVCSIFCFSGNAQGEERDALKGTRWECKIAEACIKYL